MHRVAAAVLSTIVLAGAAQAAPDCDGGWIKKAKVSTKRGRLDVLAHVVRPGVAHDTLVGPAGLTVRLLDVASGAVVHTLAVPQAAFVTRGKRTRASGDALAGTITLARGAGQADAVSLRVQLEDVVLPAGAFDLRAEVESGAACTRTCISTCTPGKKSRVRCAPSAAYRPFDDLGFGDFTGPARKRPDRTSAFCGLTVDAPRDCDPLIEEHCLLPYPSSRFLVPDASTPTGLRVHYGPASLPENTSGKHVEPADWNTLDGFSPAPMILALFPDNGAPVDLAASGVAPQTDFGRSLDEDHPIVLMNAATGERIVHFAELDANTDDLTRRALIIRPGKRLEDGTRYLVAIRNLVDTNGTPITPRLVFRALRDATSADEADAACGSPCGALVDERKAAFDYMFATLAEHGVDPSELVLAWDFTTASTEALTGWLVSMRDQVAALPTPSFTATGDDGGGAGINDDIYLRIEGTFQAPLFLTADAPASRLNLVGGVPTQNGYATVPFVVDVPRLAWSGGTSATAFRASLWGHGLLGDRFQLGALHDAADTYGYIVAAVDMQGMAEEDVTPGVLPLTQDFSLFHNIPERLQQGLLNHLLLGRLLADPVNGFNSHAAFRRGTPEVPLIDTSEVYYSGGSQGGIFGLTIMAVSEIFPRGFLAVPGANYSTLLHRAAPFRIFRDLLRIAYPDPLDEQVLVALAQQLWDRADPIAYLPHILSGDLSTPPYPHRILMHMARCDSQVSNLGTEIALRSLGIPQVSPAIHSFFDVPEVTAPIDGSAFLEIDWGRCGRRCNVPDEDDAGDTVCTTDADCPGVGDPPDRTRCDDGTPALANLIPPFDNGAHGAEGSVPADQPVPRQVAEFLRPGGVVNQYCAGTCDPD